MFKGLFLLILFSPLFYLGVLFVHPDVAALKTEKPGKTSFMAYREEEGKSRGTKVILVQDWIPLSQVSPYVIKAVLIGEDDKFYTHEGFDVDAMVRALEKDIKERKLRVGGSTISQQLAKNLYLTPSKNPLRKVKEAVLTWRIEKALSKKRILELYLNVAEWGEGIFGIEAASRHYYHKPAMALTSQEAARLAAILPNPRKYSPLGTSRYVDNRSRIIHSVMVRRGIVTEDFHDVIYEEQLQESPPSETLPMDTPAANRHDLQYPATLQSATPSP